VVACGVNGKYHTTCPGPRHASTMGGHLSMMVGTCSYTCALAVQHSLSSSWQAWLGRTCQWRPIPRKWVCQATCSAFASWCLLGSGTNIRVCMQTLTDTHPVHTPPFVLDIHRINKNKKGWDTQDTRNLFGVQTNRKIGRSTLRVKALGGRIWLHIDGLCRFRWQGLTDLLPVSNAKWEE